ncbi:MAG TPA: MerR family transcriptional regulator [Gaiellaceae bacterium]|nr:MerR family transcriptional regulator [Gaiellaceae bacterium]
MAGGYIRIGELSRRTGVSPELLRAWERRYGLFEPDRSPGRFRLYSDADVDRVEAMRGQIADGLSAAEAARRVLGMSPSTRESRLDGSSAIDEPVAELRLALETFDDAAAHAAIDRLIASLSLESFLREVILPLLRDIGEGWELGEITIAQEHFASNLVRGRLMALGRGWGRGTGHHALLAAPPGEQHDLGLVVLALVLRDRGWRVTFLGADTPVETIADTRRRVVPEVIVLAMLKAPKLEPADMRALARGSRVLISGRGASPALARKLAVEHFAGGPIEAAAYLANGSARGR